MEGTNESPKHSLRGLAETALLLLEPLLDALHDLKGRLTHSGLGNRCSECGAASRSHTEFAFAGADGSTLGGGLVGYSGITLYSAVDSSLLDKGHATSTSEDPVVACYRDELGILWQGGSHFSRTGLDDLADSVDGDQGSRGDQRILAVAIGDQDFRVDCGHNGAVF